MTSLFTGVPIGSLHRSNTEVEARCDVCEMIQRIDLEALIAKAGPAYSLWDRRCRCRLTEGCEGWNRFFFLRGVFRPMWDEKTALRWMLSG